MVNVIRSLSSLRHQQGIATLLVVILTGLSLTAITMGVMYRVRGAQDTQMSMHAQTQAQIKAWEGVQIISQLLNSSSVATAAASQASTGTYPTFTLPDSQISAVVTSYSSSTQQMVINVTGTSGNAVATLQATYQITSSTTSSSSSSSTSSAIVVNGDLNYSGGTLQLVNGSSLANVAVNGNITIGSGATAAISGCATGNITLSGGGVTSGAYLYSLGTISISNMSSPTNISLWAKNITVTQNGGTYTAVKAGGYNVNVLVNGSVVGTAVVGGTLSGTAVIPSSATITATLTNGSTKTYSYPTDSSGTVSLQYTSVNGGAITFADATVGTLWGNAVSLTGWSGNYTTLKANSNISMVQNTIGTFLGGGNLTVTSYSLPTMTSGKLVGSYSNTGGNSSSIANLTTGVASSNAPGLPGLPSCSVTTSTVSVSSLASNANYYFYFDSSTGDPMVTIQNVNRGDTGASVAGTYDLKNNTLQTLAGYNFMQCQWYNASCFTNSKASSGWNLSGIYNFPPGIAVFVGALNINGLTNMSATLSDGSTRISNALTNSLLSTGSLTLGSSAGTVVAPNFASAASVCGGSFYPSNLCSKSGSTWSLTGLSLANDAIVTNSSFSVSGWTLYGNVITGGSVSTGGATTTVYGGLYQGMNGTSSTTASAGGLKVDTSSVTSSQANTGVIGSSSSSSTTTTTTQLLWVRYL